MMDQSCPTGNAFAAPTPADGPAGSPLAGLPPLLASLLPTDHELLRHLPAADLRELAKFSEAPNLGGLSAHPIGRPWPAAGLAATDAATVIGATAQLPLGPSRTLARLARTQAWLVIEGRLGAAPAPPFRVAVLVPLGCGRLSGCLHQMLIPEEPPATGLAAADYCLLLWPEPLVRRSGKLLAERLHGHWPAERTGLLIGTDDPTAIARDLLAAAAPTWTAAGWHPVAESDGALPPRWLEKDAQRVPIWQRALLPAHALVRHPQAWPTLTAPGAWLFGVPVTPEGEIPPFYPPQPPPASGAAADLPGWFLTDPALLPG